MTRCVTTLEVLRSYFMYRLNETSSCKNPDSSLLNEGECKVVSQDALAMIYLLAYEAEEKHRECFDNFIDEAMCDSSSDCYEIIKKLQEVSEKLFDDNCMNWGRLIALISFSAYFCYRYACHVQDIDIASTFVCKTIEWLTSYVTCKAGMWIECNGGWELFMKCREQDSSLITKFFNGAYSAYIGSAKQNNKTSSCTKK